MEHDRNQLLNARQAAEYLGISLSTLGRVEREGNLIPFRTPGGHRRYRINMLDEYLELSRGICKSTKSLSSAQIY
ncbi:MAG: helix-turn-helix domain-containing protein [Chloroflexi bacterium]|nr:helix-turn-helix domain-containing protein [Chloroflexota bacterium]